MNENRNVFGLNGVTGMLIATAILLSILVWLTMGALNVQNANAENFYEVKNEADIRSGIGGQNPSKMSDHIIDVK